MADRTRISWCDATLNWWWSCQEVSPGCDNCYARTLARRRGVGWGPQAPRVAIKGAVDLVARLRRRAQREGRRLRVFTNSMSDFFDAQAGSALRPMAWEHIRCAPELDFLILTKRPKSIPSMLPSDWGQGYPNVWLGVSVEDVDYLWRVEELVKVPAVVHFLSCEPLLGRLTLEPWLAPACPTCRGSMSVPVEGGGKPCPDCLQEQGRGRSLIQWCIVGGESGPNYRRMGVSWLEAIVDQCRDAQVPVWVKQDSDRYPGRMGRIPLEYRIQELPRSPA